MKGEAFSAAGRPRTETSEGDSGGRHSFRRIWRSLLVDVFVCVFAFRSTLYV